MRLFPFHGPTRLSRYQRPYPLRGSGRSREAGDGTWTHRPPCQGDVFGVISTQVLQEFFPAATGKPGIPPIQARQHLRDLRVFDIIQVTPEIIEEGIDCSIPNTISFWDGLIIASAAAARCAEPISEDLVDGQMIQGVAVRNPFR